MGGSFDSSLAQNGLKTQFKPSFDHFRNKAERKLILSVIKTNIRSIIDERIGLTSAEPITSRICSATEAKKSKSFTNFVEGAAAVELEAAVS
jgi:hypothetical protein